MKNKDWEEFLKNLRKEEEERLKRRAEEIQMGCDKCSQWDEYFGCRKCKNTIEMF